MSKVSDPRGDSRWLAMIILCFWMIAFVLGNSAGIDYELLLSTLRVLTTAIYQQ